MRFTWRPRFCGNGLIYYGIHALETAYAVLGGGAVSCLNVGQPGRNIVRVRFEDGRDLVLLVGEPQYMTGGFRITVYGKNGRRSVEPDLADLYLYLMAEVPGHAPRRRRMRGPAG